MRKPQSITNKRNHTIHTKRWRRKIRKKGTVNGLHCISRSNTYGKRRYKWVWGPTRMFKEGSLVLVATRLEAKVGTAILIVHSWDLKIAISSFSSDPQSEPLLLLSWDCIKLLKSVISDNQRVIVGGIECGPWAAGNVHSYSLGFTGFGCRGVGVFFSVSSSLVLESVATVGAMDFVVIQRLRNHFKLLYVYLQPPNHPDVLAFYYRAQSSPCSRTCRHSGIAGAFSGIFCCAWLGWRRIWLTNNTWVLFFEIQKIEVLPPGFFKASDEYSLEYLKRFYELQFPIFLPINNIYIGIFILLHCFRNTKGEIAGFLILNLFLQLTWGMCFAIDEESGSNAPLTTFLSKCDTSLQELGYFLNLVSDSNMWGKHGIELNLVSNSNMWGKHGIELVHTEYATLVKICRFRLTNLSMAELKGAALLGSKVCNPCALHMVMKVVTINVREERMKN